MPRYAYHFLLQQESGKKLNGQSGRLLKLALPIVKTHGFTREALALSVLSDNCPTPHDTPLSDTAITALFGRGNDARRALVNAWLDDARGQMALVERPTMKSVLTARLRCNEPILQYLPEAYALLGTPGLHLMDPGPALEHAAKIADEACHLTKDPSMEMSWYARRASLTAIYTAAELHQLTSPQTTYAFLDSLLDTSTALKSSLNEVGLFGSYVFKSWAGIIKSSGVL
ncbi:hypothetical protein PLICRDRAFT_116578 [Plicaturopsis crispa FD-325 SS-3]|uniref:Ubiquinone biosynthesis protein n=1 Tax=Plicaturopsis crispa FD-325 SS-3 TaxID=944288 RepID=A0A0C9T782_PLICR|nr:hypothetical protein PLICRDRAFT_116578 [Plicaturopsis crispa FD-325 SS-3]